MRPQWELNWQDYYEILEVRFEASEEAITGAYRGLVKRYHPDNKEKGDAQRIKLLNEAYETLEDPVRRKAYDQAYRQRTGAWQSPPTKSAMMPFLALRGRFAPADLAQPRVLERFGAGYVSDLLFCDGQTAVIAAEGAAFLVDLAQGRTLWEIDCPANCAALAEEASILAVARQERVYLWDLKSGQAREVLTTHTHMQQSHYAITSIAITSDGRLLATGGDDAKILLYDVASGQQIYGVEGHASPIQQLAFSADGQLLSSTEFDGIVRLFGTKDRREMHRWEGGHAALSASGRLLATHKGWVNHPLCLWEVSSGRLLRSFPQAFPPQTLMFSPNERWLAWADNQTEATIFSVDVHSGQEVFRSKKAHGIEGLRFAPDSQSFNTIGIRGALTHWELPSGRQKDHNVSALQPFGKLEEIAWSPDGRQLATGGWRFGMILWEVSSGREIRRLGGEDTITAVAFNHDGSVLASTSDNNLVRAWDAHTGRRLFQGSHELSAYSVAISPDGRILASGGADDKIRLWDLASGRGLRVIGAPSNCLAMSPDGSMLASGRYDEKIRLWDVQRGAQLLCLDVHAVALIFTPDARELISADKAGDVFVWDCRSGQLLRRFPRYGSSHGASCIGLSRDGRLLAIGGTYDGVFRIFEYATARLLEQFEGHVGFVEKVEFSPNGDMLASSGFDGTVRLWRLSL